MLFPKLLYVSLFILFGSAIPYLPLFYDEQLRLSSDQIGVLLAIAPFVQSLACPIWTVVVDRHPNWHGPLMSMLAIIGGLSIMSLMLLPPWFESGSDCIGDDCNVNDIAMSPLLKVLVTSSLALLFAFFGQPTQALVDSAVLKILGDQKILYGNQRLWGSISNGITILLVGLWIGVSGINTAFYIFAIGVVCFAILALFTRFPATPGREDDLEAEDGPLADGGETRSLIKGSRHGSNPYPHNQHPTYMSGLTNALSTSTSLSEYVDPMPRRDSVASYANTEYIDEYENDRRLGLFRTATSVMDVQAEAGQRIANMDHLPPLGLALSNIPTVDTTLAALADITRPATKGPQKSTLMTTRVWTFLLTMLLLGISYSMIAQFLFLFLRNDLGIESSLIGWTGPIGGIAEVSTFWVSNKLLEEFTVSSLIGFAHIALIIRNLVYSWLTPGTTTSVILALGLHLVNGSAYALAWSTSVSEVDTFFPPDQRAVAQGILAALFNGLGFGSGCILGGAVYEQWGAKALTQTSAAVALLSLIVFLAGRPRS
ncbi:major facilitator superfamily domain-containing protein [Dichotomocladium elegans]|nr:major facilitator superfamily domain-containing protein [Dichotomocladium elegans]